MTIEEMYQVALTALADIAYSEDMTLLIAKAKAKRIYEELNPEEPEEVG